MPQSVHSSLSSPRTVSATALPITPPAQPDLSRPRLKQIVRWIRDELDLRVARDGPDVLRSDDVLTIHETLVALKYEHNITISDLRATGIHKAVQDIAGVATRWPGRLCDDCDKIIDIWTAKFGPFSEIHPFLHGRGGRLEGIASIHEHSREALLKRWAQTCPEKIHPKRSHKLGNLGFVAGQWWINPLFAHHAGIIGLEACDGGTTYDKHGAYALLLKDTGEIEAASEERFTYRVPQDDKGKFRLTSATLKSRDPVRVLRSHSINSVWGPKAGVRFEGLYTVSGWSIKKAKNSDVTGGQWKEGDILFDVRFERTDFVPMEVVTKRPTATEVDDYAEYKRLRKSNRDAKRKETSALPIKPDFLTPLKTAPQVMPTLHMPPKLPQIVEGAVLNTRHKGLFKHLQLDEEACVHMLDREEVISPKSVPGTDPLTITAAAGKSKTLAVPAAPIRANTHHHGHGKPDISSTDEQSGRASLDGSNTSSAHTSTSAFPSNNIREVTPWIDYDVSLTLLFPTEEETIVHQRPIITQSIVANESINTIDTKSSVKMEPLRNNSRPDRQGESPSPFSKGSDADDDRHGTQKDGDFKHGLGARSTLEKDSYKRKSILIKGRYPMAKLFDGVVDGKRRKKERGSSGRAGLDGSGVGVVFRDPFAKDRRDEDPFKDLDFS
ncbi:hypothetical protein G6011_10225 [Alternaria panax]|uniref:YDG domain-containing protein n=1 Tax=Alternaria panax TaxID=48097 RepID=A0AAD4IBF6_9PLEO|nr:hypothetical protein G6011_10225 [Alternaria panax]